MKNGDSLAASRVISEHRLLLSRHFYQQMSAANRERMAGNQQAFEQIHVKSKMLAQMFAETVNDSFLQRERQFYFGLTGHLLAEKQAVDSLYTLGYMKSVSDPHSALQVTAAALEKAEKLGDLRRMVNLNELFQTIYYNLQDYPRAIASGQHAAKIAQDISYVEREGWIYPILGSALTEIGDYRAASSAFARGIELGKQVGDRECQLDNWWRLGISASRSGDIILADQAYQAAILLDEQIAKSQKLPETSALRRRSRILFDYGKFLRQTGQYSQAEQAFKQSLELLRNLDQQELAPALVNFGALYADYGMPDSSIKYYQLGLDLFARGSDSAATAATYILFGDIFIQQRQYEKAREQYSRAQDFLSPDNRNRQEGTWDLYAVQSWMGIARAELALDHLPVARAALQKASEILDRADDIRGLAEMLLLKAQLQFRLEEIQQTEDFLDQAERYAKQVNSPLIISEIAFWKGVVWQEKGELKRALAAFDASARQLESGWKTIRGHQRFSYFERLQTAYQRQISILFNSEDYQAALDISERSRARGLLQDIGKRNRQSSLGDQPPAWSQMSEVHKLLASGQAVMQYKVADNDIYIFWIDADGVDGRRVSLSRQSLTEKVAAAAKFWESRRLSNAGWLRHKEALLDLSVVLVGEFANRLSAVSGLVIIPDDILVTVPFGALMIPKGNHEDYLLQITPLSYAPGLAVLNEISARRGNSRQSKKALFALANPTGNLPYAEREVEQISRQFEKSVIFAGISDDGETRLKQLLAQGNDFRVLHFATHAVANSVNPFTSFLQVGLPGGRTTNVTALSAKNDGQWTAGDIAIANLDGAELVILSACRTARGRNYAGEGVVGLSRAFLESGTAAVISTLWDVDDRYTEKIMVRFYQLWLKEGFAKSVALQKAQLELVAELSSTKEAIPIANHWAAFKLTGMDH